MEKAGQLKRFSDMQQQLGLKRPNHTVTLAWFSFKGSSMKLRSVNWGVPLNSILIRRSTTWVLGRLCCARHDPVVLQYLLAVRQKFGNLPLYKFELGLAYFYLTQFPLALQEFESLAQEQP